MKHRSPGQLVGHGLLLAALAVALSGCDVMVGMGGFGGKEIARDQWTRSYPLAAGGQLEIVNANGAIETDAADGNTVEVTATRSARAATVEAAKEVLQKVEIQEETPAGGVRLTVKAPSALVGGQVNIEFKVKVPRTAALRLVNSNGRITVIGAQGAVKAEVSNGSVTGRGLTGPVDASTTNGSVSIDVDAVAEGGIKLATTNGGVQLMIPSGAKADLQAACTNGGVNVSNLTLQNRGEQSRRRVEGALNGGGPRIELGTTNGGIKITGK